MWGLCGGGRDTHTSHVNPNPYCSRLLTNISAVISYTLPIFSFHSLHTPAPLTPPVTCVSNLALFFCICLRVQLSCTHTLGTHAVWVVISVCCLKWAQGVCTFLHLTAVIQKYTHKHSSKANGVARLYSF